MLDDGTYDALVFDADRDGDGPVTVELTILDGEHKGAVVSVSTDAWAGDPIELLGIPATIAVDGGMPSVTFEP